MTLTDALANLLLLALGLTTALALLIALYEAHELAQRLPRRQPARRLRQPRAHLSREQAARRVC